MKPAAAALAFLFLFFGIGLAEASLDPVDWQSQALGEAETNNTWFFWPDGSNSPRIFTKGYSQNATVKRAFLTGGPPTWTLGDKTDTNGLNKEGAFVQTGTDSGYYLAGHASGGSQTMRCLSITGAVTGSEVIDSTPATFIASVSACIDGTGILHAAWVRDPGLSSERLCYARREGGVWEGYSLQLNGSAAAQVRGTAIVATSVNDVRLFYTLATTQTVSLYKATPKKYQGVVLIVHTSFPAEIIENFVDNSVMAMRMGALDRVFYFTYPTTTTRILKRWVTGGSISELQSIPAVSGAAPLPRNIFAATAPDGRQRVAWYDGRSRRIHYLKPTTTSAELPYTAAQPVQLANAANGLADADLLGFQFGADGTPFLLCRRTLGEGYVCFPNDNFDVSGNGRPEIVDEAFNSEVLGLSVLPVGPPATGLPTSGDKFKIEFPTIGSATSNGVGAVVSSTENLKYEVETSVNGLTWTKISTGAGISYSFVSTGGTNPNQRRTFTGVFPEAAPGTMTARFARLIVTRAIYPY